MSVLGIDLSLVSTGVALVDDAGAVTVSLVTSKPAQKDPSLRQRRERLVRVLNDVMRHVDNSGADLVVIEGPSFGQKPQIGTHDRAGLWWLVVDACLDRGVPIAEVSPSSRMRYATGKGMVKKDVVLAAVIRRYPQVDVSGNDEADALLLAVMGARALGHPVEASLPQTHTDAMTKVRWPAEVTA